MFPYDTTGVKESGDFSAAPPGNYTLRITETKEAKTQRGDLMVKVVAEIAEGPCRGKKVWHNVCFLEKDSAGAGISKHWLHALGLPYEGKINVDHTEWRGRLVSAKLDIDTYTANNGATREKNIIKETIIHEEPLEDSTPSEGILNKKVPF